MLDNVVKLLPDIYVGFWQTLFMVGVSAGIGVLLGTPLGIILFLTSPGQPHEKALVFRLIDGIVNIVRSFPFIILLVALIPFTRIVLGTTLGPAGATLPMSVAAVFYFARLAEQTFRDVPKGVLEAAEALGASTFQTIFRILLVEARSGLVSSITILAVGFISYSAMAGVVGGGGIGDLAIRYGYYRFQTDVMVTMVIILIALVQVVQLAGNTVARIIDKR